MDKTSSFFIYFTDSELRRKGCMTADQRRQREVLEEALGRPDPKAIQRDMAEVLQVSLRGAVSATVYSDLHPAYPGSLKWVPAAVTHLRTDSKVHRGIHNPLFEVNRLDMLIVTAARTTSARRSRTRSRGRHRPRGWRSSNYG